MERSPYVLAALASVAVPGLDPTGVEPIPSEPAHEFDLAFVTDTQERRWVVRAPRTQAAAARMEESLPLLGLLARRLPFGIPAPRGFAAMKEGGRACVYPALPGHTVDFSGLPSGRGLAVEIGRAIAAVHNVDARLFDEAGLPAYDADTYRTRRLADLDRAAGTGRVPSALLARWERALEDVNLWRFAPTPVHGDLTGDQLLVVFADEDDVTSGTVRGMTGWEDAKVADPADDFAYLVADADPEALETVMEAYAHTRVERPDPNLLVRARLASELSLLTALMHAISAGFDEAADAHAAALRRLDEEVHAHEEAENDYRRTSLEPVAPARRSVPPPPVVEEEWDEGDETELVPVTGSADTGDDDTVGGADSGEAAVGDDTGSADAGGRADTELIDPFGDLGEDDPDGVAPGETTEGETTEGPDDDARRDGPQEPDDGDERPVRRLG
ncbi:Macrolide 2'-phosphotransferase [Nostocoides japonicum T1-X7]|uniref:Macrolide 2'-phosphotransferase n=1 Tax=Nostocoides japonicum T1-X7 TaxID=1194083 RepID=A0A077LUV4_9MICO|nr:phosphotransferase [Tetrasphaera japonica]CCH77391.1 Macrolide 2'-phosphotransferase [Tetrasphaera japonica T1-X7]